MTEPRNPPVRESAALEMTVEAVVILHGDGRIAVANPSACAILQAAEPALLGRPYLDWFTVATAGPDPADNPVGRVLAGFGPQMLAPGVVSTGADSTSIVGSCSPLGANAGSGAVLVFRRFESDPCSVALRISQARLEEVQRTARLGNWEIDLRGGHHHWSDELYRIFEIDRATLGNSLLAFMSLVHPDDRPLVEQAFDRSLRDLTPYDLTHRIVTGQGRIRHVHSRGEVVSAPSGQPLRSVGTLQDVTEQQLAAERIRFQATLMESVSEAVVATDAAFGIVAWNSAAEALYGYSEAEAVGQHLPELVPISDPPGGREQALADLRRDGRWRGEVRMRHRDGHQRDVLSSVSTVADARGHFVGYVAVNRDVTELRALERERAQLEAIENLGRLAGGIAHDFNNALQAILGHAELARVAVSPTNTAAADLDGIRTIAARAADLARHLQALAGEQVAQPVVMDLNDGVERSRAAVLATVGDEVAVDWHLGKDLWQVRIDPLQVERLLQQLAANAREAMADGGRLEITTTNADVPAAEDGVRGIPAGEYVTLTVRDDGPGMDPGTLERACEPLFSTKSGSGMTGLGLAVVAGIVRQNAGTIRIESALGQGTAVRIHLPRWTRPAPPQAVAGPLAAGLPSCTVLLVEDEEPVRNVTRRGLERAGFRVVSFGDPVEALAHVARDPGAIDLLITDVMMPGLTGKQLVDRMAVLKPGLRSLFVSGYPADAIAQQGVVDADIDLLQKPYTLAELASRVRRMLESPG